MIERVLAADALRIEQLSLSNAALFLVVALLLLLVFMLLRELPVAIRKART